VESLTQAQIDEQIAQLTAQKEQVERAEQQRQAELQDLIECMEAPPPWAPDIPLGSAGFISPVFMKD